MTDQLDFIFFVTAPGDDFMINLTADGAAELVARRRAREAAEQEPSDLVKASPFLMGCWALSPDRLPELEHLARAAVLLREQAGDSAFSMKREKEQGPDYWTKLSAGAPNQINPERCLREFSMLSPDKQKL